MCKLDDSDYDVSTPIVVAIGLICLNQYFLLETDGLNTYALSAISSTTNSQ